MRYDWELFIVRVEWDREGHSSPWCGPIVGSTRTNEFMTLLRKRMRANNKPFVRVVREPLRGPHWLSGMDCMQDPVDRLLSDVFSTTADALEL